MTSTFTIVSCQRLKRLLVACALLLMVMLLGGCTPDIPNEKEVRKDVMENLSVLKNRGMEITDFEIDKRKTDEDEKLDIVYVSMKAKGDGFTYSTQLRVYYVLYNEGWQFENYYETSSEYLPTRGVDPAEPLKSHAERNYDMTLREHTTDLAAGKDSFTYDLAYTGNTFSVTQTNQYEYAWDKQLGYWMQSDSNYGEKCIQFIKPEDGTDLSSFISSMYTLESAEYVSNTHLSLQLTSISSYGSRATLSVNIFGGTGNEAYVWTVAHRSDAYRETFHHEYIEFYFGATELACEVNSNLGGSYCVYLH